jgi:hypothetical protein
MNTNESVERLSPPGCERVTRSERLRRLMKQHGRADECADVLVEYQGERWALMEGDARAGNGGPWWSVSDDWGVLLDASARQEYPEDWPALELFDLTSEFHTSIELRYAPVDTPPESAPQAHPGVIG